MQKTLKNERGVTLIELLAVIVILGIIAAIAVPAVMSNFDKAKENADSQTESIIIEAIQRYFLDNPASTSTVKLNIAASESGVPNLVESGYLAQIPKWSDGTEIASVEVTLSNGKITNYKFTPDNPTKD